MREKVEKNVFSTKKRIFVLFLPAIFFEKLNLLPHWI